MQVVKDELSKCIQNKGWGLYALGTQHERFEVINPKGGRHPGKVDLTLCKQSELIYRVVMI